MYPRKRRPPDIITAKNATSEAHAHEAAAAVCFLLGRIPLDDGVAPALAVRTVHDRSDNTCRQVPVECEGNLIRLAGVRWRDWRSGNRGGQNGAVGNPL